MRLELDAGNSRIKWRLVSAAGQRLAGDAVAARGEPEAGIEKLLRAVDGSLSALADTGGTVTSIAVASVRGADFQDILASCLGQCFEVKPVFATVSAHCAGVTNAYEDVSRMGVDRWLAMLAAWQACQEACCIVDCGSAMTVDLIGPDGQHLGGYIVPGMKMMLEAMAARTPALQHDEEPGWLDSGPGVDTRSAMEAGVLNMALGLLTRVREQYPGLRWYLTGGDAPVLASHLQWQCDIVPELVLDGLALANPVAG